MAANRLLIIDDEPDIANLVAKVAHTCSYDVRSTSDAAEFRAIHREWQPTHISLDLHMPGMDGVEIIRFLALEKSSAQILVMSGFDAKVVESARRLGTERGLSMAGALLKPLRVADLQKFLNSLRIDEHEIDDKSLQHAIESRELFMMYQPKVKISEMNVSHFEALVRWRHEARGDVFPNEFVPIAERAGLIGMLTREVARLAIHQVATWHRDGAMMNVAINISGKDLSDISFADELNRLCREYKVEPKWITLELTETAAAANAADAIDILTRLRLMGFNLSIDDFGTGYSSLTQLHRLPFSELKIDKEFVADCATSAENQVIVKTIIDLAHNLSLSVVAEGAEKGETVNHLATLHCDYVQGYYFSKPLHAQDVMPWIEKWVAQRQLRAS
ncbi:MAG TPA: EAL domain-containing response regulator [Magnetospirillaceae bacterium]|jgi:EAL domain-containing protein (putative c-di-GMP-specific phosphodiesterase class I)